MFENRQTLWFRVQEILRIARLAEPARVQRELDLYNRLLPGRGRLQAALLLTVDDGRWGGWHPSVTRRTTQRPRMAPG